MAMFRTSLAMPNFGASRTGFKTKQMEDTEEDYGQVARYLGTIPGLPHGYELDEKRSFVSGKLVPVSGNTAEMLGSTWLSPHFEVTGDQSKHYGACGAPVKVAGYIHAAVPAKKAAA